MSGLNHNITLCSSKHSRYLKTNATIFVVFVRLAAGSVLIFVTRKSNSVELADNLKTKDFKGEESPAFMKTSPPFMVRTVPLGSGEDGIPSLSESLVTVSHSFLSKDIVPTHCAI